MPADPTAESPLLPSRLKYELWRRVDRRLQRGEVLISTEQFQEAMEREFRRMVRLPAPRQVRELLRDMIVRVNESHPETFLTLGIKNAIASFIRGASSGNQDPAAQDEVRQMLQRVIEEGRTAFFLESIGVELKTAELTPRIEAAIARIVAGQQLQPVPQDERQPQRRRRRTGMTAVSHVESAVEPEDKPAQAPLPDQAEQEEWAHEEEERQAGIVQEELNKAPKRLADYARQGLLSEEEARDLQELSGIEARLARGEIDQAEAERLRSGFAADVREKLARRLREAVDPAACHLSVFEGLRRIPSERDPALRFLIRFKEEVLGRDEEGMSGATILLEADQDLLAGLVRLMERRDHELRIIAARLPPYRRILGQPDQSTDHLVVEESFVEQLRALSRDEVSERLNSPDDELRVRTTADIRCTTNLLNQLVRSTPFQRAVRQLHIQQTLDRLYRSTPNPKVGRQKLQHYLSQRLPRLYPDLTVEERAEIEAQARALMAQIEEERKGPEKEKAGERESYRVYRTEHKDKE